MHSFGIASGRTLGFEGTVSQRFSSDTICVGRIRQALAATEVQRASVTFQRQLPVYVKFADMVEEAQE